MLSFFFLEDKPKRVEVENRASYNQVFLLFGLLFLAQLSSAPLSHPET